MFWTPLYANKQKITEIRHEPSYKQLESKTNRTSFPCGNRNGHQSNLTSVYNKQARQQSNEDRYCLAKICKITFLCQHLQLKV